jgi:hypothetical protein
MVSPPPIVWRVHLRCSPEAAFASWTTDEGRERFWAERSEAGDRGFTLHFINGQSLDVEVIESVAPGRFEFRYFGGSTVTVELRPDGLGGCDVWLHEDGVSEAEHLENYAGWVSVLLSLKAALDFDVDLRGHDPGRSWDQRYVDN